MVEGYNGCKFCDQITKNLGVIYKDLAARGMKDVSILVINVKPESDAKDAKDYMQRYLDVGIPKDNLKMAFPKSRAKAVELQTAIEATFNKDDPDSHGMKIGVIDKDGICRAAEFGASKEITEEKLNTIKKAAGVGLGRN